MEEYAAPLTLTIDSLSPSVLGRNAPIVLRGEVTNTSDETWERVNVYPFASWHSPSPRVVTDQAALAEETQLDPEQYTGDRYTGLDNNTSGTIDSLDPGESAPFVATITEEEATAVSGSGVYWVGVHAVGESASTPRDDVADGKARTFMPLVRGSHRTVPLALVMSLRGRVNRTASGALDRPEQWAGRLGPSGRLTRLVEFGQESTLPMSWLVDPAMIDAVAQLARGNPGRNLGVTVRQPGGSDEPSGSPSGTAEAEQTTDPDAGSSGQSSAADQTAADGARRFLDSAAAAMSGQDLLVLPYGDTDLAGAIANGADWLDAAIERSDAEIAPLDLQGRPAVAPANGRLSSEILDALPDDTVLIAGESTLAQQTGEPLVQVGDRQIVIADESVSQGGPGPGDTTSAISLRQQILAAAALSSLDDGQPLVVVVPPRWSPPQGPAETAAFFEGLEIPWISAGSLADIESGEPTPARLATGTVPPASLGYANLASAQRLTDAGRLLDDVLYLNDTVADEVHDEALTSLSTFNRFTPRRPRARADASTTWIDDQLEAVTVEANPVLLSSDHGSFNVTVVNGMDQPVEVRVKPTEASTDIVSVQESKVLRLQSGDRATRLLQASASKLGEHDVELQVTTDDGRPVGPSVEVPVRVNQVSNLIWGVVGLGAVLLFGTIALRLIRRGRAALRTRGERL